jgi:hypothetical protein
MNNFFKASGESLEEDRTDSKGVFMGRSGWKLARAVLRGRASMNHLIPIAFIWSSI